MTEALVTGKRPASVPLRQWVRRAYFRTALVPLLLVEVVIIAVYLWVNDSATREHQDAMRALAHEELARLASREAAVIDKQLAAVSQTVEVFRQQAGRALVTPFDPGPEERARYIYDQNGVVYYTAHDNGGSSLYYSGFVPVGTEQRDKALRSAQLDPLMRAIVDSHPLVTQVYLNTADSMNRIYPFIDGPALMPPRINLPSFNFFYEADERHNPERRVVWTEVYLDPAGKGWMTSCVAPVYQEDGLAAVVGVDVTVASIVRELLNLDIPWQGYGVIIDQKGTIVALPAVGESEWGLEELTEHEYTAAVKQVMFKPERFQILHRPELAELAHELAGKPQGLAPVQLGGASRLTAWSTIPQTGWRLLLMVPTTHIYAHVESLGQRLLRVGMWTIGAMLVFSTLFLLLIDRLAWRMARSIARPIERVGALAERIGKGEYEQQTPIFPVAELQDTAVRVVAMGRQLGATNQSLQAAQHEAERARDQALEGSRLKSEFLASVSHEIRTPMSGILGMLDLLLDTRLEPVQQEFAGAARDSGQALLLLINDILDFSKIEAGKLEITEEPFAPRTVIEGAADLLAPRAHQKRLELMSFVDPRVPGTLAGDPGRLRQVLLNLVGNAVKFTDPGGEVSIRVVPEQSTDSYTMLRFSVTDTGIGISAEAHKRLFQPFTQVDGSSARRHGGTGLGLSICKRLVELMGGEIGVESREGVGSTFWFRLPLKHAAPADQPGSGPGDESAGEDEDPRHPLPRFRALVVEHRPGSRAIIEEYLRSWDATVTAVASAAEAMGALGNTRKQGDAFDCILISLPPGSEGESSLLRALNGDPALRAIPRILLADLDEQGLQERARARGFTAYLTKPIHQSRLFDCLVQVMHQEHDAGHEGAPEATPKGERARTADRNRAGMQATPATIRAPTDETLRARILLAEDNQVNQKVAIHRLRKLGYAADIAENGRDAVDKALSRFYDLILMDVQMPVMDGIEAMREIRSAQAEHGRQSTIVAVTANAMSGDRERLLDMGMDDYISKPYQLDELQLLVHRWLDSAERASS